MESCKDKVAIVTGSAGGLGKEFAKRLLDHGCKVCLSDINQKLGDETRSEFSNVYGSKNVYFVGMEILEAKKNIDSNLLIFPILPHD